MNLSFKYWKPSWLIFSVVSIVTAHSIIISNYQFPGWISGVSVVTIVTALIILYDRVLWKIIPKPFLTIKNLGGRYRGTLKSLFDKNAETEVIIEITQTASQIKIRQFNKTIEKKTQSKSFSEDIIPELDGTYEITFGYRNDGAILDEKIKEHSGFCILKSSVDGQFLEGTYFTNRDPQTKGQIRVHRDSSQIKGHF